MKAFKTLLAASALIALSATASLAGGVGDQNGAWNDASSTGSNIINGQINLQNAWSNLNGSIDTTGSDATAAGAAAGNLIDITTMNNTTVKNSQIVGSGANIGSNVNVDMNNVWGNATSANQVLCNGASVSTDPTYAATSNSRSAMRPASIPASTPTFPMSRAMRWFRAHRWPTASSRLQRPQHADHVPADQHLGRRLQRQLQPLQYRRHRHPVVQRDRQHLADHPLFGPTRPRRTPGILRGKIRIPGSGRGCRTHLRPIFFCAGQFCPFQACASMVSR